jgi:hypothetical protein
MAPGQNKITSAIKAAPLTSLAGFPGAGFVRWYSVTLPPKTVAQELMEAIMDKAKNNLRVDFFM